MIRIFSVCAAVWGAAFLWTGAAFPQPGRGGINWSTANADPQRTAWIRTDPQISRENVQKGVVQFLWKQKLGNEPRQLNALTQPVVIGRLITYKGFKDLMFVSGSGDKVFSIDHPTGKIFWEQTLPYASTYPQQKGGTWTCPGGLTASMSLGLGAPPPGVRGGPGGPPAAGAPAAAPAGGAAGAPPSAAGASAAGRGASVVAHVYALSSDGLLHMLNQHTGTDVVPAVKLVRSNAQAYGLIVNNNMAYAATRDECGGALNGVWALDLAAPVKALSLVSWQTGGANIEGSAGIAIGSQGTIYAATGAGTHNPAEGQYAGTLAALDPKTLKLNDWFSPSDARNLNFSSTPVVFTYKEKEYVVAGGQEGRLYLLDSASLGGADHQTPLYRSAVYSAGKTGPTALASWEDSAGVRWVLAPVAGPLRPEAKFPVTNGDIKNGAVVAFKLVEESGKLTLQPGWVSRDLVSPAPPIVMNGVVFALSSGAYLPPGNSTMTSEQRAQRSSPAVLYALDASNGKELWNSGKTITSFSSSGGLAAGASKVFVSTADSTLYAFGYAILRD
jgi:outer membrane protein assembly factor BamB